VGARIRRRRLFGAVGAVAGMWATVAWTSTSGTWRGLLRTFSPANPAGIGNGWFTFFGGEWVLVVNIYGILVGFTLGLVIAEWTGRKLAPGERRTAVLAPRVAGRYLPRWAPPTVTCSAGAGVAALLVATFIPDSLKADIYFRHGIAAAWWWSVVLLAVGVVALATRSFVLSFAPHAATDSDLAARETTRALTAATMTIVALAAFTASTASTLTRISTWFAWGWGDGTATAGLLLTLLAEGLVVAAFFTPYWMLAPEREPTDPGAPIETTPSDPIPA
jgi:hypothetical protein